MRAVSGAGRTSRRCPGAASTGRYDEPGGSARRSTARALIDLVASRSYVMGLDDKDRKEVLDSVESLAPAWDRFELPYTCEVWRAFRRE